MNPKKIEWTKPKANTLADGNLVYGTQMLYYMVFFARLGAETWLTSTWRIRTSRYEQQISVLATLRYDAKRIKETGKAYMPKRKHFWTLKDGKIVKFQQYVDTQEVGNRKLRKSNNGRPKNLRA